MRGPRKTELQSNDKFEPEYRVCQKPQVTPRTKCGVPDKPKKPRGKLPPAWIAFINQEYNGEYTPARLIREISERTSDTYDIFTSQYTSHTHISSHRRNKSHKCISRLKSKRGGPSKDNIRDILGSFLETDGTKDGTLKTKQDVYDRCKEKNLPIPSFIIETSPGHFHIVWLYWRPLPWTPRNERWWLSQQPRLIKAFIDFGPDIGACLNPVQFLRNPSEIDPFNYKRNCPVKIERTVFKTNLKNIHRALTKAGIQNERIPASQILREYLRQHKLFTLNYSQIGDETGLSERTIKREVPKAIVNGDLRIIDEHGNNKYGGRVITYESLIYLEPYIEPESHDDTPDDKTPFSKGTPSISQTNPCGNAGLLGGFLEHGAVEGLRNKTIFACGLYEKCKNGGETTENQLYDRLYSGFVQLGTSENEYRRTIRNVLKSKYIQPLSKKTLIEWGLIDPETQKPHASRAPEVLN